MYQSSICEETITDYWHLKYQDKTKIRRENQGVNLRINSTRKITKFFCFFLRKSLIVNSLFLQNYLKSALKFDCYCSMCDVFKEKRNYKLKDFFLKLTLI